MQFNSAIALAVLTFTTSAVAQGWDYYGDNGLYAREVDEYDQILSIREEAYLEGYLHGLTRRAGNTPAPGVAQDAQKLQTDAAKLQADRQALRTAQSTENKDVAKDTAGGQMTAAQQAQLKKDAATLAKDQKAVGADKKNVGADKKAVQAAANKIARRALYFDDYEYDYDY